MEHARSTLRFAKCPKGKPYAFGVWYLLVGQISAPLINPPPGCEIMARVEIARLVHRLQHLAAQEDHLRRQSAAAAIQRRTGIGYIEYSIMVASRSVIV